MTGLSYLLWPCPTVPIRKYFFGWAILGLTGSQINGGLFIFYPPPESYLHKCRHITFRDIMYEADGRKPAPGPTCGSHKEYGPEGGSSHCRQPTILRTSQRETFNGYRSLVCSEVGHSSRKIGIDQLTVVQGLYGHGYIKGW